MPVVEIRDLHKRFGKVEAVKGLSFEIEAGRVTGFLGPNGAGKSTTLRALLGLVRPTAGTATFGGRLYHQLDRPSAQLVPCSRTPPFTRAERDATTYAFSRLQASIPTSVSTRCCPPLGA